jgi:hypothetical protein
MTQYAVLIYAHDSAHGAGASPQDTELHDRHAEELAASGSMVMAYALTPRDLATSIRRRRAAVDGGRAAGRPRGGRAAGARRAAGGYQYLAAVKADLLSRAGRAREAAGAYRQAFALAANEAERAFLAEQAAEHGFPA